MIVTRIVYKEKPTQTPSRFLHDFEIRRAPNGPVVCLGRGFVAPDYVVWRGRGFVDPDYMERSIRIALKVLGGVETSCS